ncbi:MAG: glycosyltransferase family 39 protein [Acidimicrobiia bacterium]|nr:glycosyltransferase family 39 protein [Acidimicrobiia bacterium]
MGRKGRHARASSGTTTTIAPVSSSSRPTRGFLLALAAICVLGAAIRIGFVVFVKQDPSICSPASIEQSILQQATGKVPKFVGKAPDNICGDALVYHDGANLLAEGEGFISPIRWIYDDGVRFQSADHPPLYNVYLAGWSVVGLDSVLAHQLASVLLGVASIALVGLLGRRLVSERAGLLAAFLTAIYVYIWVNDGLVMSETISITAVAGLLLLTYRYIAEPTRANLVWLGIVTGLTVLTRAEIALYVPIVLPFVIWWSLGSRVRDLRNDIGRLWRPWLGRTIAIGAISVAVTAPWVVRNLVTFEKPVTLSTGLGITLTYANCDATYNGPALGWWSFPCLEPVPNEPDQSLDEVILRQRGIDYIKAHLDEVPKVVAARVGRVWNVFRPFQQIEFDQYDDRPLWTSRLALGQYYLLMPLAAFGAWVVHQRRKVLWPLLSMYAIVTFTAATSYGSTRFRTTAEVATVVLAGIALDRIWQWLSDRRTTAEAAPVPSGNGIDVRT